MLINLKHFSLNELIVDCGETSIYSATRLEDGAPVWIKIINNRYPTVSELARLRHAFEITRPFDPNRVLRSDSFEQATNTYFLVYPNFTGIALEQFLKTYQFEIESFLKIAIALAEALGHIHQKKVIHEDINPRHIFIDPNTFKILIGGFSNASVLSKEHSQAKSHTKLESSPTYASPELFGRMHRNIDHRSDIYSLGVILYRLCAGVLPFESSDFLELMHYHLTTVPEPPSEVNPDVPLTISHIIMKCLNKIPEDRYFSSFGLLNDLQFCLNAYIIDGHIPMIEPGQQDVYDVFRIPQKLYGRELELKALKNAFEYVAHNHSECVMIGGYSGIGKTSLVEEAEKNIIHSSAYFVRGKFDQLQRDIPYTGVIQACRDLIQQMLTESDTVLIPLKERLFEALQTYGQLMINLIPELELIIGKQPTLQETGTQETQNRLQLFFGRFIRAFATGSKPLVIFLDDLQWADPPSLNLIRVLMTDKSIENLLVIGAYRDNETSPSHPLMLTIQEIEKERGPIQNLILTPLDLASVIDITSDTLHKNKDEVMALGHILHQKTGGNPFFLIELLKNLYLEKLIWFNPNIKSWEWNLSDIRVVESSENVVDLMIKRIMQAPKETQTILTVAAAIGVEFDIHLLARHLRQSLGKTLSVLWRAITDELVDPIGDSYKLIISNENDPYDPEELQAVSIKFGFAHDRIQQAAYLMLTSKEQSELHYKIAHLLLESTPSNKIDDNIFEITSHLNRGFEEVKTDEEKKFLSEINLKACLKAKKSAAFGTAFECIDVARRSLDPDTWKTNYSLAYQIYLESAECAFLVKRFDLIDALSDIIMKNAKSNEDKARLYILKIDFNSNISENRQALRMGIECAALFGLKIRENPTPLDLISSIVKMRMKLRTYTIDELETLPPVKEKDKAILIEVLTHMTPPAFIYNKKLFCYITNVLFIMTVDYGSTPTSSLIFQALAGLLEMLFHDYKRAYELGRLAIRLSDNSDNSSFKCRSNYVMAIIINHWTKPLKSNEHYMIHSYTYGLEAGELAFISYLSVYFGFLDGAYHKNIQECATRLERYKNIVLSCKNKQAQFSYNFKKQFLAALMREDFNGLNISNNEFNEQSYVEFISTHHEFTGAYQAYVAYKSSFLYLFRHYEKVIELFDVSMDTREALLLLPSERELNFYYQLTLLALYPKMSIWEKMKTWWVIYRNLKKLITWTKLSPFNNSHRLALVKAEIARVQGKENEAIILYEKAGRLAQKHEFITEGALANELAAKFYLEKQQTRMARSHLMEAHYGYFKAGIRSKVVDLELNYTQLRGDTKGVLSLLQGGEEGEKADGIVSLDSENKYDITAVFRASNIIAREIHLLPLLQNMLKIVMEIGGADRIIFLQENDDTWVVQADKSNVQGVDQINRGTSYEDAEHLLPSTVIQYVSRMKKEIILNDVSKQGMFAHDPFILQHQPKSILCIPLKGKGKVTGILYLENRVTTEAFPPAKIEVLKLLTGQIATSIENATLYTQLEDYNKNLEEKVNQRTAELNEKNSELEETLNKLERIQKQVIQQEKLAALGILSSGIAHEIKNPLNFINNFSSVSEDLLDDLIETIKKGGKDSIEEAEKLSEDLKGNLKKIEFHSKKADQIVLSLMKHSKATKGTKTNVNLNRILKDFIEVFESDFKKKYPEAPLEVDSKLDPNLSEIQAIPEDIGKSIRIILDNAFYAVGSKWDQDKLQYTPIVSLQSKQLENAVEIIIRDNGTGIAKQNMDKLFQPFFSTKPTGSGTGLGLSIAYDIVVQEHHGHIHIDSKEGDYTQLTIRIPER